MQMILHYNWHLVCFTTHVTYTSLKLAFHIKLICSGKSSVLSFKRADLQKQQECPVFSGQWVQRRSDLHWWPNNQACTAPADSLEATPSLPGISFSNVFERVPQPRMVEPCFCSEVTPCFTSGIESLCCTLSDVFIYSRPQSSLGCWCSSDTRRV